MRRAQKFIVFFITTIIALSIFVTPASAHSSRYKHNHQAVYISDQQRAENINHTYVRVMERWKSRAEWDCLFRRISHESGFNHLQWNKGGSSAYGIGQAMTKTHKLEGTPYMGTPYGSVGKQAEPGIIYQINWTLDYVQGRYGRPCRIPKSGSY